MSVQACLAQSASLSKLPTVETSASTSTRTGAPSLFVRNVCFFLQDFYASPDGNIITVGAKCLFLQHSYAPPDGDIITVGAKCLFHFGSSRSGFSWRTREGRVLGPCRSFVPPSRRRFVTDVDGASLVSGVSGMENSALCSCGYFTTYCVATWFGGIAGVAGRRMVVLVYRKSPVPSRSPSLFPSFPHARFLHLCQCLPFLHSLVNGRKRLFWSRSSCRDVFSAPLVFHRCVFGLSETWSLSPGVTVGAGVRADWT